MNAHSTDLRGFGSARPFSRARHFRIAGSGRPEPAEREKPGQVRGTALVGNHRDLLEGVPRTLVEQRNGHPAAPAVESGSSVDRLHLQP
jgi:hypothetical protein